MAKRYYQPLGGDLALWNNPDEVYVRTELEIEVAAIEEIMSLNDVARKLISECEGSPTLEIFDIELARRRSELKNLIDFFDYDNTQLSFNVKDGKWFTPIAIEDVCGEEVGHEAILTLDGLNNTYWQHDVDEAHQITWQLRDYKKRISKIELRVGSSSRNLLTDLDVYISNTIVGLDNENNRVITGANITTPSAWVEIPFDGASKVNGQYIRFTGFGSQHASNQVRIQEIRAWVVIVDYT